MNRSASISELLNSNDLSVVLNASPVQAGLALSWPYFRLYLLNAIWAVPLMFVRDDWTWWQVARITAGCFGVGFCLGFVASLLFRASAFIGTSAATMSTLLALPATILPIVCAVDDGPEFLGNPIVITVLVGWGLVLIVYWVVFTLARYLDPTRKLLRRRRRGGTTRGVGLP